MDYNAAFWANDLNKYINRFQANNVPFLPLEWQDIDGKTYYSIIASPCGFTVVELIGDSIQDYYKLIFKHSNHPRFYFTLRNGMYETKDPEYLIPLKVSRSTERMDEVKNFYTPDIGVSMIDNRHFSDGSELAVFMYDKPYNGI